MNEMRPVPSAPGYHVTDDGRVFSSRQGSIKQRRLSWNGRYFTVAVRIDGRRVGKFVHCLVCEAFRGPRPSPDHQVRHLDSDGANNSLENLAWGTRLENMADKRTNGTAPIGSNNPRANITETDVARIRARAASGEGQTDIGADMGIPAVTISQIVCGDTWAHVAMPDMSQRRTRHGERQIFAKMTEDKVREARRRSAAGERTSHLAREFGMSHQSMASIVQGTTWKHLLGAEEAT